MATFMMNTYSSSNKNYNISFHSSREKTLPKKENEYNYNKTMGNKLMFSPKVVNGGCYVSLSSNLLKL